MSLNRARLELVSGARFGDDGVEELQELFTMYTERGADLTPMPFWDPDHIVPVAQQESRALRALVEGVWMVWLEHGGQGHGGRWDVDPDVNGPVIRLLQELFQQNGIKPPSARTLRRALQAVQQEEARLLRQAYGLPDKVKIRFGRKRT
jgi:hypothetical protein